MSASVAELLASLYGESTDANFVASGVTPLLPDDLPNALAIALQGGHPDAAEAIHFELRRLGGELPPVFRGYCYGASHGLWRLQ